MEACGFTLAGVSCEKTGDHFCEQRAQHIKAFIETGLVHTKGKYARRQFRLTDWQFDDIVSPLFGETEWSEEHSCYRRRYRVAWIEMARKALEVSTPILTANKGWVQIGDVQVGDLVINIEGQPEAVDFVSDVYTEPTFRVTSRFGRSLVAGADHEWAVKDRTKPRGCLRQADGSRLKGDYLPGIKTTEELAQSVHFPGKRSYRWVLPRSESLKLDSPHLPVDPYCLGAWLGDGASKSGEMVAHEDDQPFMRAQFENAGYETTATRLPQVFYVRKLMTALRALGVLRNKHVPERYLLASEADRLDLLRGLMDTDGWATYKGNSLMYGFCSKLEHLADAVMFLARSFGYDASKTSKRAKIAEGRWGTYYEVHFSAIDGLLNPHRMPRKADKTRKTTYRSGGDSIVSVEGAGIGKTRCIGVPSGSFLAGRDLMPTANCGKSELLAAIMLYVFFCDGEYGAELYSVATDRKQASVIFDVAMQMILLNPKLARLCKPIPSQKRIVKLNTNSIYQVLANDAPSALGSNPSAVAADEILAWPSGDMWSAMRTGMGSMARVQPLLIAATTAGNDTESFGGLEHSEMAKILEDPERNRHTFVYMRNTPADADPFDESRWHYAAPALGDFLSLETMREMALEAKNNPTKLNGFRQFQLNQWVGSSVAWMPMHLFDLTPGTVFKTGNQAIDAYAGKECWFGLDLAAVSDLCSMCYLFPADDGSVDLVWRFWAPEEAVEHLDRLNDGRFSQFAAKGWLTVTEGNVVDYSRIYDDIECDARRFTILGGDADQWCTYPVIQEIENRTYLGGHIAVYKNDFAHMSDGMHRVFDMVNAKTLRHHGNPLARFCFDSCEAKISREDPDLIRPDKKHRQGQARRIDGVPAAIMAMNAYYLRGGDARSWYEDHEVRVY